MRKLIMGDLKLKKKKTWGKPYENMLIVISEKGDIDID